MRVVAWRVARLALLAAVLGVSDEHSYSYDRHADPAFEEVEEYFSDGRAEGYFSVTFLNRTPRSTLKLSRVQSRGAARVVPPSSEKALAPNGTLSFSEGLIMCILWPGDYVAYVLLGSVSLAMHSPSGLL